MNRHRIKILLLIGGILILLTLACSLQGGADPTAEIPTVGTSPELESTPAPPNPSSEEDPTPTATHTPIPQPTQFGGGSGEMYFIANWGIYDLFRGEIYNINLENEVVSQVSQGTNATQAYLSPDGSKLILVIDSPSGGGNNFYLINADGSGFSQITNMRLDSSIPQWSPDSSSILFTAYSDSAQPTVNIYRMNSDGSNLVQLSDESYHEYDPMWSPDATTIYFNRVSTDFASSKIMKMNADGSDATVIINDGWLRGLSPDGTRFTYVSNETEETKAMYVSASDGSGKVKIDSDGMEIFDIVWSPDSQQLAYIVSQATAIPTRTPTPLNATPQCGDTGAFIVPSYSYDFFIAISDADGSNFHIIHDLVFNGDGLSWSPDGKWLAFTDEQATYWDVYIIQPDGNNLKKLVENDGREWMTIWRP